MQPKLLCQERLNCNGDYIIYSSSEGLNYYKCSSCGLIWRDPNAPFAVKEKSQTSFNGYKKRFFARLYKARVQLDIIEANFEKGKMLEIGSRLGDFMIPAKGRGWITEGIEPNDYAIEQCKEKKLNVNKGSWEEIKNNGYDFIVMRHVLQYLPNPFDAIDKVHESLKSKGGVFIVTRNGDYYKANLLRGKYHALNAKKGGRKNVVIFNYPSLRKVLENAGFNIVQENYPIFTKGSNNPVHTLERLIRKAEHCINLEKEILVLAQKKG